MFDEDISAEGLLRGASARRDAEVTKRLNQLFADPDTTDEQRRTASELDVVGTDWSDERW